MAANSFNNVGNGFGDLTDDDDNDALSYDIDGSPITATDTAQAESATKHSHPQHKQQQQSDDDLFDEPISDDDDAADPNEIFAGTADQDDRIAQQPEQQQQNPLQEQQDQQWQQSSQQQYQQMAQQYAQSQQQPQQTQEYQQQYEQPQQQHAPQPEQQYEQIPDGQQPSQQYTPQQYAAQQPEQQDASLQQPSYQSQFSIPSPETIARIVIIADMLRNDLNAEEKNAVKTVLGIAAIKHDETSEVVYSMLNARKSTMKALEDFLTARSKDPSDRAFYLIRIEDGELKNIIDLGKHFGYESEDRQQHNGDHVAIAQYAATVISETPEQSISLLSATYNIYEKSQEVANG